MSKKGGASEIMTNIPLPSIQGEKRFVAYLHYQIPSRIILNGRTKTSPKFETMYGLIYWLNKQPYHMEYVIYRTDKNEIVREGFKKLGEVIV